MDHKIRQNLKNDSILNVDDAAVSSRLANAAKPTVDEGHVLHPQSPSGQKQIAKEFAEQQNNAEAIGVAPAVTNSNLSGGTKKDGANQQPPANDIAEDSDSAQYAGFWRRFGAITIDMMIFGFFSFIVAFGLYLFGAITTDMMISEILSFIVALIFVIAWMLYFTLSESSTKQATVGKRISGIIVTDMDGERVSITRALTRHISAILNYLTLYIGYIMIGLTKKKQGLHDKVASCQVIAVRASRFWKLFIMVAIAFLIVVGGIGYYLFGELSRAFNGGINFQVESTTNHDGIENVEIEERLATEANLFKVIDAGEEDLEAILSGIKVAFSDVETDKTVSVGPVALKLDQFWDDADNPRVWLNVKTADFPNVRDLSGIRVKVDYVLSTNNQNLYNPEGQFETERVTTNINELNGEMWGIRAVSLLNGAKENLIAGVKGKIILKLPIDVEATEFMKSEHGHMKESEKTGFKVTLEKIEKNEVKLKFEGNKENFMGVYAYNADGKQIREKSNYSTSFRGSTNFSGKFEGIIEKVKVVTKRDDMEREYPFVIGKTSNVKPIENIELEKKPVAEEDLLFKMPTEEISNVEPTENVKVEEKLGTAETSLLKVIGDVLSDNSIVFYIDDTGQHGLAARPLDENFVLDWHASKKNVESYGSGWRLPTKTELDLLFHKKNVVGGFTAGNYWSSTEKESIYAWTQYFKSGTQGYNNKKNALSVRVVRAF